MRRRQLSNFGIAALLLIMAACIREPDTGVGMKRIGADLIFGVPQLQDVAAPPGAVPEIPESLEVENLQFRSSFRPNSSPPAVQRCPEAGDTDVPAEPAPTAVTGKPKEGLYVWKMAGTHRPPNFNVRLGLPKFMDRSVEGLEPNAVSPSGFSFNTRETVPSAGSRTISTQTFRVDQSNPSANLRGIFLTRVEEAQPGSSPTAFTPTPPILYLPLPVQIGATFQSQGVDPSDPTRVKTLLHEGRIQGRTRIDACGTLIDAWLMVAKQTYAAGDATNPRKFHYAIATHFGGLIVFEHGESPCASPTFDGACTNEPQVIYDTNIGQTEPDPLGDGQ